MPSHMPKANNEHPAYTQADRPWAPTSGEHNPGSGPLTLTEGRLVPGGQYHPNIERRPPTFSAYQHSHRAGVAKGINNCVSPCSRSSLGRIPFESIRSFSRPADRWSVEIFPGRTVSDGWEIRFPRDDASFMEKTAISKWS